MEIKSAEGRARVLLSLRTYDVRRTTYHLARLLLNQNTNRLSKEAGGGTHRGHRDPALRRGGPGRPVDTATPGRHRCYAMHLRILNRTSFRYNNSRWFRSTQ